MQSHINYSDKLKDPRWQKKRLEILQRDDWTCQKCFDTESTLHVHHKRYIPNTDPWDYPDELLITLCAECHEIEMELLSECTNSLVEQVQEKFLAEDIRELTIGFHCLELLHLRGVVASAIGWAISDENMQKLILDKYIEYLKKHNLDLPVNKDNNKD